MNETDVWVGAFWGWVRVPRGTSHNHAEMCAYIAWKGGCYEDVFKASFAKWFRRLVGRRPDLASVYVHDVYPVDELRWLGEYRSSPFEPPTDGDRG